MQYERRNQLRALNRNFVIIIEDHKSVSFSLNYINVIV